MTVYVAINLTIFFGLMVLLWKVRGPNTPPSKQILAGLFAGASYVSANPRSTMPW